MCIHYLSNGNRITNHQIPENGGERDAEIKEGHRSRDERGAMMEGDAATPPRPSPLSSVPSSRCISTNRQRGLLCCDAAGCHRCSPGMLHHLSAHTWPAQNNSSGGTAHARACDGLISTPAAHLL